jgi:hypothetical protein
VLCAVLQSRLLVDLSTLSTLDLPGAHAALIALVAVVNTGAYCCCAGGVLGLVTQYLTALSSYKEGQLSWQSVQSGARSGVLPG